MNIGLFLSGHKRNAPFTHDNFKQFIETPNNVDVYISTWDDDVNNHTVSELQKIFGDKLKHIEIENYLDYSNSPEGRYFHSEINLLNYKLIKEYPVPNKFPISNTFVGNFYKKFNVFNICPKKDFYNYDICIYSRLDLDYRNKPDIPLYTNNICVNGYAWAHRLYNDPFSLMMRDQAKQDNTQLQYLNQMVISDHMIWGKPQYMDKFFQFYCNMITMFTIIYDISQYKHLFTTKEFYINSMCESWLAWYMTRYPFFDLRDGLYKNDLVQFTMAGSIPNCDMLRTMKYGNSNFDLYRIAK